MALNRYDADDDLHRRNHGWLAGDDLHLVLTPAELAGLAHLNGVCSPGCCSAESESRALDGLEPRNPQYDASSTTESLAWAACAERDWRSRRRTHDREPAQQHERSGTDRAVVIDDVDKAIIEQLQQDGRLPYTKLATAVGLSEAAVRQRVQRLVESGVVQIVAVTDPLTLGFRREAMIG